MSETQGTKAPDAAFEETVRAYCSGGPADGDADRRLRKRPDGEYESGTTCDWLHFWNSAMGGSAWQPIETAPKDGAVLVYDMGIHIACYDTQVGGWESLHESDGYGHPSRLSPLLWMRLPDSPTQDTIAAALRDAMIRERDRRDREGFVANHDAALLANVENLPDKTGCAEMREAAREVLRVYGLGYTGYELRIHLRPVMDRLRSALEDAGE